MAIHTGGRRPADPERDTPTQRFPADRDLARQGPVGSTTSMTTEGAPIGLNATWPAPIATPVIVTRGRRDHRKDAGRRVTFGPYFR